MKTLTYNNITAIVLILSAFLFTQCGLMPDLKKEIAKTAIEITSAMHKMDIDVDFRKKVLNKEANIIPFQANYSSPEDLLKDMIEKCDRNNCPEDKKVFKTALDKLSEYRNEQQITIEKPLEERTKQADDAIDNNINTIIKNQFKAQSQKMLNALIAAENDESLRKTLLSEDFEKQIGGKLEDKLKMGIEESEKFGFSEIKKNYEIALIQYKKLKDLE